jgi:uncharacterized protein
VSSRSGPLRIPVAELRRRPGNRSTVERTVPVGGLGVGSASTPTDAEAQVVLHLESQSDGVTVKGEVRAPWTGECRRCLEPTGGELSAEVTEVFSDHPDGAELLAFDGDAIDLSETVRDAVVLALPLAPLCRSDCPGPEPDSFPVRIEGEAGLERSDPRWAALDELRFDRDPDEG